MRFISSVLATTLTLIMSQIVPSQAAMAAADINVVSGGAFKQVLSALVAQYEKETGNKVAVTYQTVGQHLTLIKDGKEEFDVAVLTPEAIDGLAKDGKVVPGTRADLARVGVGVAVKSGAPLPDISTDEAFRRALLAAKSVAYIDPKAGGSSGIYVDGLLKRLGIAGAVQAKAVLVRGGAVADHVADGEAEIGIHQISEILPVAGVTLVGPLPADIQNYTTYAAGVGAAAKDAAAAKDFVRFLTGAHALPIIKAKGMEPPTS
jgi:molybdate transport system substrate-binding protein